MAYEANGNNQNEKKAAALRRAAGIASRINPVIGEGTNIILGLSSAKRLGNNFSANVQPKNSDTKVEGGQEGPLSSDVDDAKHTNNPDSSDSSDDFEDENSNSKDTTNGLGKLIGNSFITTIFVSVAPFFLIFLLFFIAIAAVSGLLGDYEDAFGMSSTLNEETGGIVFSASTPEQQDFFNRVSQVKLSYQAQGKVFDAMSIVAVYHVLNNYGAGLQYKDMTTSRIKQIADAMLVNSVYSETAFKQNLINKIIPLYIGGLSQGQREDIADEVIDYVDRYNSLVGREDFSSGNYCGGSTSCSYDIKGYYIHDRGNVNEKISINNIYVRLMQCGIADGHNYGGTFGQPVSGEELVPFEKYILGVAYQEIGDDAEKDSSKVEAFKAQMVAARSFILARHVDMGGWRTLKKEGDKWVLQVAACTQDQVYCDPDQGCSSEDGQWKMVFSGTSKAKKLRDSLPQDSKLRQYASQTSGEVLVNEQGYIVYADYGQKEQNQMTSLSKSGFNYKQILLQIYNQGSRNYGAKDIKKSSCLINGQTSCVSSGPYSQWKQRNQPWSNIPLGNSTNTIGTSGCLVTSLSMLIAKSGAATNVQDGFNPGSFVTFLNGAGGFSSLGEFLWNSISKVSPSWRYDDTAFLSGLSREQKLNSIKEIVSQPNTYAVVEVEGDTGQHWVAIDSISGNTINMMDPSTNSTDMWSQYNWVNTSKIVSFKVM